MSRESLVVGCGKLVWDARAIASHYVRSLKGFWFDAFVILPVPQVRNFFLALIDFPRIKGFWFLKLMPDGCIFTEL